MRITAGEVANAIAWAVLVFLIAVAIVLADVLGFFALLIFGLFTWLICTHLELDDDTPTSSTEVYRARMAEARSPEQRAAVRADRQARLSPLRFYRWCGITLTVIGAGGWAWQQWGPS